MEYTEELGRGKVPQAERAEDGECLVRWGRGNWRGKCRVFVKCLCCLIICTSAKFEDGSHLLRERTSSSVFIWRIEPARSARWVYPSRVSIIWHPALLGFGHNSEPTHPE